MKSQYYIMVPHMVILLVSCLVLFWLVKSLQRMLRGWVQWSHIWQFHAFELRYPGGGGGYSTQTEEEEDQEDDDKDDNDPPLAARWKKNT